eukprot:m.85584 g.85584  ORF g.85584 m.85584 type:complete len:1326 (-) comp9635_c0_seq3:82-4059(-)
MDEDEDARERGTPRTSSYTTAVQDHRVPPHHDHAKNHHEPMADGTCPYDTAGLWGRISYRFVLELLRLGYSRPLQLEDLPPLRNADRADTITERLEEEWRALGDKQTRWKRPLWWAVYRTLRPAIHLSAILTAAESATMIAQPILVGYFVEWMLGTQPVWHGVLLGIGLIVASFAQAITHHLLYYETMKGGWNCRIALTGLIHKKLLRLHSSFTSQVSTGFVINLIATDVQRMDMASTSLHFGYMAVIDLSIITFIICYHVGYRAGFAGIGVMLATMCLNMRFSKGIFRFRKIVTDCTSSRTNVITEVLSSMLSVKAFGWERPFTEKVHAERRREAQNIRIIQLMKSVNATLFSVAPMLASFTTFAVYWRLGNRLSLGRVLTVLALYQVLRTVIGGKFVRFVENYPEAHAAMFRFQDFLRLPEFSHPELPANARPGFLTLDNVSFRWSAGATGEDDGRALDVETDGHVTVKVSAEPSDVAIDRLSLSLQPGQLLVVAGEVGSGKSALLLGILGELPCVSGTMRNESARMAYVPQSAWIKAGTLRDNIVFGAEFDASWYDTVVSACCLKADIANFPDGEETEIGARGINLSGGQKARIVLARAVYSQAPIVLLDDPLSAVDPHVARELYQNVIRGLLANKSVVLVTHHPHFMQDGTTVLVLGKGGVTIASGSWNTVKDLVSTGGTTTASQSPDEEATESTGLETPGVPVPTIAKKDSAVSSEADHVAALDTVKKDATALVLPEDRVMGVVTLSTYLAYMSAGGFLQACMVLLLFLCAQGLLISVDYQLQRWASSSPADQSHSSFLELYGVLAAAAAAVSLVRSVMYYSTTLRAASRLHRSALSRILLAPMAFFTANPLGRIVNRFSSDQGQADTLLPDTLFMTLNLAGVTGSALIFACIAIPYLAITFPFIFLYLRTVREFATRSLRELKRLDGTTRSPVKSSYVASIQGLVAIRAFRCEEASQDMFLSKLHTNAQAWYWWLIGNRWIGFRLDLMCTWLLVVTVILAICLRRELDSGLLGLAFVYMNSLSGLFQFMVRQSALVETYMTSIERLLFYGKHIMVEQECQQDDTDFDGKIGHRQLELADWPRNGEVIVRELRARYREDLPEILHGISFVARSGTKVGVVGRTGAGKSSLVQSIFRLNNVTGGSIVIGGVDTKHVPLHMLRSRIGLIPQEAELFSGSVRYNIDPFGDHTNEELRAVLDEVNLANVGLDMVVAERGSNLSAGQKQLVSLARAMVRRPKVVVIDEATANVDYATDAIIQTALRESTWFRGSTRIIIAHRIRTIEDSDVILVLDQGNVDETGPPNELRRRKGRFSEMLEISDQ